MNDDVYLNQDHLLDRGEAPEPEDERSDYDFEKEAQRLIEAIEPQRGATMTVLCALHEAFEAGQRLAIRNARAALTAGDSTP